MSFQIGIGFSQDTNAELAARKAAIEARRGLAGKKPTITFVFCTIHYPPETTVPFVIQSLPEASVVGCSVAGIILQHTTSTRGFAVLTISHPDLGVGIGQIPDLDAFQDLSKAGTILAQQSIQSFSQHQRDLFICFMPGHIHNLSTFLAGVRTVFGNIFPMVGAGSADDFHFQKTFQIINNQFLSNSAVGLLLGSTFMKVGIGSRHGWRPIGKPRFITRSNGSIIQFIDKKPAVKLYEEFFEQKMSDFRNDPIGKMTILYPLGILSEDTGEYLLRNPVDILYDGSILCQGDVPQNSEVHIMIGNKETCKQAFEEAAQEALNGLLGKPPQLVLIIESMSRLKLFGNDASQEHAKIRDIFGAETPIIGFYANGEICPSSSAEGVKRTHLQNESVVICAIG